MIEVGADEGHVELDILKGELQDAHEVGVAGPEVIERDRGALRHEHIDILMQARFVGEGRLCDLEAEGAEGDVVTLCNAADAFGHVNIAALDRREVDIEPLQAEFLKRVLVQEQAGFRRSG